MSPQQALWGLYSLSGRRSDQSSGEGGKGEKAHFLFGETLMIDRIFWLTDSRPLRPR